MGRICIAAVPGYGGRVRLLPSVAPLMVSAGGAPPRRICALRNGAAGPGMALGSRADGRLRTGREKCREREENKLI